MIKSKDISAYKTTFNGLTYDMHISYIKLFIKYTSKEVSNLNKLCQLYAQYGNSKYYDIIQNVSLKMSKDISINLKGIGTFAYASNLSNFINNEILLITNNITTIKYFDRYAKPKFLAYNNYEYSDNDAKKAMIYLDENKYKTYHNFRQAITKSIFRTNIEKASTIICRDIGFIQELFINIYQLTRLPILLFYMTMGLITLKRGGNLIIFMQIIDPNPAIKKILDILSNSFQDVRILYLMDGFEFTINCKNYKDNISDDMLNKLIDITVASQKYYHPVCKTIEYINNSYGTDQQFIYPLTEKLGNKTSLKKLPILDDIDIDIPSSPHSVYLAHHLKQIYDSYMDNMNYNILKYITYKDGKIDIDQKLIDTVVYKKIIDMLNILIENKIPYNKTYLAYINKYNKNLINDIYAYRGSFKYPLIDYQNIASKKFYMNLLNKLGRYKGYHYDELTENQDTFELAYKVKQNLFDTLGIKEAPPVVRNATEDLTRGVARYLTRNYKTDHPISNGFVKLWEIYATFKSLIPNKKTVKIFHIAEAPGQWIHATNHYCNTKKDKIENIDWRANALNPYNRINIEKYSTDSVFKDDYGFIKKYKNQWLWGADNTGDITELDNQRWYRQYSKKWGNVDLVTSDAGIFSDDPNIFQKLELAQICMVAGVSSKGTNCVIKHFLPYIRKAPETAVAGGHFMSMIMLYYIMFNKVYLIKPVSSNPDSGEFYVIGQSFRGLSDNIYEKLISLIDNFEVNQCIFPKEEIPETFTKQVIEFINKIVELNINHNEITNMLMTCIVDPNPIIKKATKCDYYMSPQYLNDIQERRFQEWIKTTKFE